MVPGIPGSSPHSGKQGTPPLSCSANQPNICLKKLKNWRRMSIFNPFCIVLSYFIQPLNGRVWQRNWYSPFVVAGVTAVLTVGVQRSVTWMPGVYHNYTVYRVDGMGSRWGEVPRYLGEVPRYRAPYCAKNITCLQLIIFWCCFRLAEIKTA